METRLLRKGSGFFFWGELTGVRSEGSEKADQVTASNIMGAKVAFRPGAEFRKLVKVLNWQKAQ